MGQFLALIALVFILYKCNSDDKPPEVLPLSSYEDVYVNVWFWFPNKENGYNLGQTKGAASCGDIAYNYAASKGLKDNAGWSYVCCTEEGESDCYRKIR